MTRPVAVVAGYIVRYPVGGMTWVFLNYLLGLRDLGFEPVFVEAAGPQPACYDVGAAQMTDDPTYGVAYLRDALSSVGLGDGRWWYADPDLPAKGVGLSYDEAIAVLESAVVLLSVGGSCWTPEFERVPRRILVDMDAPFTQIRLAEGDEDWMEFIRLHDVAATYAVNLARGGAHRDVPDGGRSWLACRPPIHLASWPVTEPPSDGSWTTITSWDAYGGVRWRSRHYGQKDVEYSRLRQVPSLVPECRFELALADTAPNRDLENFGWAIVDPVPVSRTPGLFQRYLAHSRGELGVAKHAYVSARTGAFNDRSLNYLATGRPVVCSDTGLEWLPTGEGLLTFSDGPSAARAIRAAEADIVGHGRAARRLAEEHFGAASVLAELLSDADVELPAVPGA